MVVSCLFGFFEIMCYLLIFVGSKQVNQKMILTLTASIMYWSLQKQEEEIAESSPVPSEATSISVGTYELSCVTGEDDESSVNGDVCSVSGDVSNLTFDDNASDTTTTVSSYLGSEVSSGITEL